MVIKESILTNNPCYKQGRKINVKGLMLHSVGCAQPSASVFIKNWNKASYDKACVHGFIDGNDGTVYQTLPWDHRGWHAGGSANNTHIGVEMCEPGCIKYTQGATFTCSDIPAAQIVATRTYSSAVELFAMLCQMFNLDPLADGVIVSHNEGHKRGIASGHVDPEHLWRQLGLAYTMDSFRQDVKTIMNANMAEASKQEKDYSRTVMSEAEIFAFLREQGLNDLGAAGLMGNLQAESGLSAINLQNSFNKSLNISDEDYTRLVDNSNYKDFITDKAGYGLAQWTYWSRKQALLEFAILKGTSIGDARMQCEFLMKELRENYPAVLTILKGATSVRQASDAVLLWFERPKDQSEKVQIKRAQYGEAIYKRCAGKEPVHITQPTQSTQESFRVKVSIPNLNIRKGPGTNFERTGKCTGIGVFTIVEVKDGTGSAAGWGRLKSGAGWIALSYAERL